MLKLSGVNWDRGLDYGAVVSIFLHCTALTPREIMEYRGAVADYSKALGLNPEKGNSKRLLNEVVDDQKMECCRMNPFPFKKREVLEQKLSGPR